MAESSDILTSSLSGDGGSSFDGTISNADGIDVNPGSDIDADLITVGVTGTPTVSWDESADAFRLNKALVLDDSGNGDVTHTIAGTAVDSQIEVHSEGSDELGGLAIHRHSDTNNFGSHLLFFKSGGTHASPTTLADNAIVARLVGCGYDGTDYETSAEIRFRIDGTPGNNSMPGDIAFYTNGGSQALSERMVISGGGTVSIAQDLLVSGKIRAADSSDFVDVNTGSIDVQTNNSSRLDVTDSGVRLGAANARVTTILDEDTMTSNSATALATQQSIKAYVDANAGGGLTLGTPTATTSGTSIDYTSIPSGTKQIIINFNNVSTNGTSRPIIQIGDSGGIETSGYQGYGSTLKSTSAFSNATDGLLLTVDLAAADTLNGTVILTLLDSSNNIWSMQASIGEQTGSGFVALCASTKPLSAELDRVRLTTQGGANTFDGGSINIAYQ